MAQVGSAIYSLLQASSAVTALVEDKVYPLKVPQGKLYPAVTYQVVSDTSNNCKSGASSMAHVQLSVFAHSYVEAHQVKDAIKATMDNYTGISEGLGLSVNEGIARDLYAEDAQIYHVVLSYDMLIN